MIIWRKLVSCGTFGLNLVSEQCAGCFTMLSSAILQINYLEIPGTFGLLEIHREGPKLLVIWYFPTKMKFTLLEWPVPSWPSQLLKMFDNSKHSVLKYASYCSVQQSKCSAVANCLRLEFEECGHFPTTPTNSIWMVASKTSAKYINSFSVIFLATISISGALFSNTPTWLSIWQNTLDK